MKKILILLLLCVGCTKEHGVIESFDSEIIGKWHGYSTKWNWYGDKRLCDTTYYTYVFNKDRTATYQYIRDVSYRYTVTYKYFYFQDNLICFNYTDEKSGYMEGFYFKKYNSDSIQVSGIRYKKK